MRCDDAQRALWPLEGPREDSRETSRAQAHLDGCDRCQLFFERDRVVGELLHRLRREVRAPVRLRERVTDALALERVRRRDEAALPVGGRGVRRWWGPVGVMLSAAAALVLGLVLGSPSGQPVELTRPAHFANDYLRLAIQEEVTSPTVDSATVTAFFLRELGRGLAPVPVPAASVTRAMVCLLDGRRGAMVEYDLGGTRMAHYRVPRPVSGREEAREPEVSVEMGLAVVRWTESEYEHALVGPIEPAQLRQLAQARFVSR